jgi:hypothetical protein
MELVQENDIFIKKGKNNIQKNTIKNVRFNGIVCVFLIPNINDIYDIKHLLWYDDIDYKFFSNEYIIFLKKQ